MAPRSLTSLVQAARSMRWITTGVMAAARMTRIATTATISMSVWPPRCRGLRRDESQPWALLRNPVGIRASCRGRVLITLVSQFNLSSLNASHQRNNGQINGQGHAADDED